jgi:MFS family permease
VSLWGAASAIGAAIGPLVGGVFVGTSGWQTLFWITLIVAGICVPLTLRGVEESMDQERSRTIDWAGTFLVAAILAPLILALSKGADWGWGSLATIGCLAVSIAAAIAFVYVEKRSEAPLVDLALLRNRVLIGATLGILIGAGTINGLMFLLSIYFQEPSTLGMTALEAGLATLPAAAGMVILAPLVPRIASKIGTRQAVGLGFIIMTVGFAVLIATKAEWSYSLFVLPVVAIAAGMALSNGPCSSASTSAVPERQVGSASGISNMARYVGASVWTAAVAAIYSNVAADRGASGLSEAESLASAIGAACVFLTITSALGIVLAWLAGRHQPPAPLPVDLAASAAASVHTIQVPHPEAQERVGA